MAAPVIVPRAEHPISRKDIDPDAVKVLYRLRDFDYTEARSDFWFVGKQGIIDVRMQGPAGARNMEMVFHGEDEQRTARWQQGGRR